MLTGHMVVVCGATDCQGLGSQQQSHQAAIITMVKPAITASVSSLRGWFNYCLRTK